jgi:hypothetical protein
VVPADPSADPVDWLPDSLPPPSPDSTDVFGSPGRNIRPVHLWLVGSGSALAGVLITVIIMLIVQRSGDPTLEGHHELVALTKEQPELVILDDDMKTKPHATPRVKRKGKANKPPEPPPARKKAPPPASKAPLTIAQISAGIKANLPKLGPCMQAAKKRKELKPGKHALVLDFLILPNGSVREAALTGPDYLLGTRTAKCLANKVRTWRFPPSAKGSPVRKLQLPLSVK